MMTPEERRAVLKQARNVLPSVGEAVSVPALAYHLYTAMQNVLDVLEADGETAGGPPPTTAESVRSILQPKTQDWFVSPDVDSVIPPRGSSTVAPQPEPGASAPLSASEERIAATLGFDAEQRAQFAAALVRWENASRELRDALAATEHITGLDLATRINTKDRP